jgi:polysaccharide pyruvyl transferase WcaK-like protein
MLREICSFGVESITVSTSNPTLWRNLQSLEGQTIEYIRWSGRTFNTKNQNIFGRIQSRLTLLLLPFVHFISKYAYLHLDFSWLGYVVAMICNPTLTSALRKTDVVITTGGHRITTILDQDMVCSQRLDMTIARLMNRPLVLWSQSIGPFSFRHNSNRLHAQKLLRDAERIYVRDVTSIAEVTQFGVEREKVLETVDSVFGLRDIPNPDHIPLPSKREAILGVAVYARKPDKPSIEKYAHTLGVAINHAIAKGYSIRIFPMEISNKLEQRYISSILGCIKYRDRCVVMPDNMETTVHLREVAKCRAFIAHKTHAVIFSLLSAVPLIAIAYHAKSKDFMEQFGLSAYCISDSELTEGKLIDAFDKLVMNLDAISISQTDKSRLLDSKVKRNFRSLLEFVKRKRG